MDVLAHLAYHLDKPDATFSNTLQRSSTKAMASFTDVMCIGRTGSGKTESVKLAVLAAPGTVTIVACPQNSLIGDWGHRLDVCRGSSYEIYHPSGGHPIPSGRAPILLVTADGLASRRFQQFVLLKKAGGTVFNAIVLDEFPTWLIEDEFRHKALGRPSALRFIPVPLILLGAIVPFEAEHQIARHFGLLEDAVILRNSVVRPEIKVSILDPVDLEDARQLSAFRATVDRCWRDLGGRKNRKMIVYIEDIEILNIVAGTFQTLFGTTPAKYYSGSASKKTAMSQEDREGNLARWRSGDTWMMLATSSIASGLDEKDVRIVAAYGALTDFINLLQAFHRAARGGERAFAFCIPSASPPFVRPKEASPWSGDIRGAAALLDVLYKHTTRLPEACFTYAQTKCFDRTAITCSQVAEMDERDFCSRCDDLGEPLPLSLFNRN